MTGRSAEMPLEAPPVVLADFGGTNIRCALARGGVMGSSRTLPAQRFQGFAEALEGVWGDSRPR